MIVPHRTLQASISLNFTYFDILGIFSFLSGGASVGIEAIDNILASIHVMNHPDGLNLINTYAPLIILSVTGLAFKNGLYIFMLRQFFRGIPDSLEESAYIDGSGDFRTFLQIILPMSVPMMITVFLFAFCWQWTDSFYSNMFFTNPNKAPLVLSKIVGIPISLDTNYAGQNLYETAIKNTCGIMIILPLVIIYVFLQRYLVEGIERSGLTAE
jgi:multiple sugar transport system permease protein